MYLVEVKWDDAPVSLSWVLATDNYYSRPTGVVGDVIVLLDKKYIQGVRREEHAFQWLTAVEVAKTRNKGREYHDDLKLHKEGISTTTGSADQAPHTEFENVIVCRDSCVFPLGTQARKPTPNYYQTYKNFFI